ncbi:potassium channel subfamily K member 16-like [Glandiceps talaboti]
MPDSEEHDKHCCIFSDQFQVRFWVGVILIVYLCFGAFIFVIMEESHVESQLQFKEESHQQLLDILWDMNLNYTNREIWAHEVTKVIADYENIACNTPPRSVSFSTGFYLVVTAITTIGYGDVAPLTQAGKFVMILYCVFGVPLNLLFLAYFGALLLKYMKTICNKLDCELKTDQSEDPAMIVTTDNNTNNTQSFHDIPNTGETLSAEEEGQHVVPTNSNAGSENKTCCKGSICNESNKVLLSLFSLYALYTILGAIFMYFTESEWTFVDSVYCTFISLATIGFGDFIPGVDSSFQDHGVLSDIIYFLFTYAGLIIFSACFQESVDKIKQRVDKIENKCCWHNRCGGRVSPMDRSPDRSSIELTPVQDNLQQP